MSLSEDDELFNDLYGETDGDGHKQPVVDGKSVGNGGAQVDSAAESDVPIGIAPGTVAVDVLPSRASDPRKQPTVPPSLPAELPNPQAHQPRVNMKEDGKMFIGGLNWETSDESLKNYFSQFGEVAECTVMRDGATGRSRGFGFLTFKDPKCVNTVMVKEHYLDGKIIDPKRAIPREEQDKTSKIFVGGVSQECTDSDFREYFAQFGRVLDATLMMDKDTGRPRGFGFVTFESDAAVENALAQPVLMIKDKQIEVKRATPKGGSSFGSSRSDFNDPYAYNQAAQQFAQAQQTYYNGMSPAAMAQYYRQMQQYYAAFQQQMGRGMARPMMMSMPGLNMQGMMGYGQQTLDQQVPDTTEQWSNSAKLEEDPTKVPANAPKGPAGAASVGRVPFRGRGSFRGAGRGTPGGARFNPYGR